MVSGHIIRVHQSPPEHPEGPDREWCNIGREQDVVVEMRVSFNTSL